MYRRELKECILLQKEDNLEFRRLFLLFAMVTVLLSTSSLRVSANLVAPLVDIDHVARYCWSGFVLSYLAAEVKIYKAALSKGNEKKSVGGYLLCLQVCDCDF